MTYALITGIQKIKLAGAEKRLREMGQPLRAERKNDVRSADVPEAQFRHQPCHQPHGNARHVLYGGESRPVWADYYAFNTAYGMVSGAFLSLAGIALSAAQIRPILTMVQPFF